MLNEVRMMEESTKFILITKHSNNVASERANEISNSLVLYVLIIFSPSSCRVSESYSSRDSI